MLSLPVCPFRLPLLKRIASRSFVHNRCRETELGGHLEEEDVTKDKVTLPHLFLRKTEHERKVYSAFGNGLPSIERAWVSIVQNKDVLGDFGDKSSCEV